MMERLVFKGEKFPTYDTEEGQPVPRTLVQAECLLDVPLNTVQNPKEICIHKIAVRPVWMEAADLWFRYTNLNAANEPPIDVRFRPFQNIEIGHIAQRVGKTIIEYFSGGKDAMVKSSVKKGLDKYLILTIQPGVQLDFSKEMQKFFALDFTTYSNETTKPQKVELLIGTFSRDVFYDLYMLKCAQVKPVYVLNNRREQACAVFHLHEISSVDEIAEYDFMDGDYVPLEAMLHQEKLTVYISRMSQPHVPIIASHYQLLVIASIRDQDKATVEYKQ
jgi:hypothetical protein